jgi:hypothetical protein
MHLVYEYNILNCVHKVRSGFWQIVYYVALYVSSNVEVIIHVKLDVWILQGFMQAMLGLFPHIRRSHPVCHFSRDHGRCQLLGNGVASLLLHSHSEIAYRTARGHFVESGWLISSQKAIPHKACVPAQSPFHIKPTEKLKDGRLFHLSASKKTSRVSL